MRRFTRGEYLQSGSRRIGFTLVEILVAVGTVSFVLATVALSLATLWRASEGMQRELAQTSTILRLCRQLRADAHAANAAALLPTETEQDAMLQLLVNETNIEYRRDAGRITRTQHEHGKRVHREVYPLGDTVSTSWILTSPASLKLVVTFSHFDPRLPETAPPTHQEQVEAIVGLVSRGRR